MLKELCRQYSIDSFDEKFRVITFPISDLIKRNYEAGYFLSNYPYVLSLYGVRDEQMDNLSTEELPYLATLACLTWHFRRDYFCQGTLTYRSIAEGTLLRLFCHLRELYKKNPTVSTLENSIGQSAVRFRVSQVFTECWPRKSYPFPLLRAPTICVQKVIRRQFWNKIRPMHR